MSAGANHAPHVVSAAAADIKDGTPGQIGKVRQYALPLPVGTPFGIDIHAVKGEGPFTPRHQILQQVFNPQALAFAERRFALGGDAVQQIQTVGRKLGQKLDGPFPFPVFAVQRVALPGRHLGRQRLQPVRKRAFGNQLIKVAEINHAGSPDFTAINDPKLKHWNHSSACSKPALRRRALWVSTESVSITFSSMLRFWLISSSL